MKDEVKAGRPTKYNESYDKQAYELCMLGYTDVMLAKFFNVDESTINNWKISHPKFFESIRAGKEEADIIIVNSLFKSAQDRQIEEKQAIKVKEVVFEEGKRVEREKIEYVTVTRAIPANDRSISFWLRNRQRALWTDKPAEEAIKVDTNTEIIIRKANNE